MTCNDVHEPVQTGHCCWWTFLLVLSIGTKFLSLFSPWSTWYDAACIMFCFLSPLSSWHLYLLRTTVQQLQIVSELKKIWFCFDACVACCRMWITLKASLCVQPAPPRARNQNPAGRRQLLRRKPATTAQTLRVTRMTESRRNWADLGQRRTTFLVSPTMKFERKHLLLCITLSCLRIWDYPWHRHYLSILHFSLPNRQLQATAIHLKIFLSLKLAPMVHYQIIWEMSVTCAIIYLWIHDTI